MKTKNAKILSCSQKYVYQVWLKISVYPYSLSILIIKKEKMLSLILVLKWFSFVKMHLNWFKISFLRFLIKSSMIFKRKIWFHFWYRVKSLCLKITVSKFFDQIFIFDLFVYIDLPNTKCVVIANHSLDQYTHYNLPRSFVQNFTDE